MWYLTIVGQRNYTMIMLYVWLDYIKIIGDTLASSIMLIPGCDHVALQLFNFDHFNGISLYIDMYIWSNWCEN